MTATLAAIRLYPLKGFDPAPVTEARIAPGGGLRLDRRWALFDGDGLVVNGKNVQALHGIRARWEVGGGAVVALSAPDAGAAEARFDLERDFTPLAAWVGGVLGREVQLRDDAETGFPDDRDAAGPTLLSVASLAAVGSWFPGLSGEDVRRRFRANLEIDGVEAFWEDRLVGPAGTFVRFRVGEVLFEGAKACARCVVPSRDADSGAPWPGFQKTFAERRRAALPPWAEPSRFDHCYRLSVNTRVPASEAGKTCRIGDPVHILD